MRRKAYQPCSQLYKLCRTHVNYDARVLIMMQKGDLGNRKSLQDAPEVGVD